MPIIVQEKKFLWHNIKYIYICKKAHYTYIINIDILKYQQLIFFIN